MLPPLAVNITDFAEIGAKIEKGVMGLLLSPSPPFLLPPSPAPTFLCFLQPNLH